MIKLTPSGAPRWVPCPGSAALEAPLPPGPTHPTTEEGEALHWACEQVMASWSPRNHREIIELRSFLGAAASNGVVIAEEMVWAGQVYLDDVWRIAQEYPLGLQIEKQLSAHALVEGLGGRTDALWRSEDGTRLVIWDFKYGRVIKHAFENWQLISYAMGAIDRRTESIELVLVQPRARGIADPVKVWPVSARSIGLYAKRVIEAAQEARSETPRTQSGGWCRYCKVAATCSTLAEAGHGAADLAGRSVVRDMDDAALAYEISLMDDAAEQLRARKDALEGLAGARIQGGAVVPGYAYSATLGNRSWTQDDSEMAATGLLFGVDITESKTISPAKAEGRGLPPQVVKLFTTRKQGAPALRRVDRNEARSVFYE